MAKKKNKKYNEDDFAEGAPAQDPVERQETGQQQERQQGGRRGFRGPTGYNYGEDYYFRGGKPPSKTDWDAMTQEQREQVGLPTFQDWKAAALPWRQGHMEGGGNYEAKRSLADSLYSGGASSWDDIMRIARGAGYEMAPDMGQALLKRLKMAYEGSADPTGRYHRAGDQWMDVGTSDLAKRGIPGAADYWGGTSGGIQAVLQALGGSGQKSEQDYFGGLVESGDWTEWPPGSGKYFNDPGNDPSRRVWVDRKNLQTSGSGYKNIAAPGEGPQVDYSAIPAGMRISDWLSGPGKAAADYNKAAANAPGYERGTGSSGTSPAVGTNATSFSSGTSSATRPAWGAAPTMQQRRPMMQQPSVQPQRPRVYDYAPASRPTVQFGQQQQRRKSPWGL